MKSLAAWSSNRESDEKRRIGSRIAAEKNAAELGVELDGILDKLMQSVSLYEAIDLHHKQRRAVKSWVSEQGKLVKSALAEQAERMRANLSSAVAGAIVPLLAEVIDKKAIADFCGAVEEIMQKAIHQNMVIAAPARLHQAVVAEMERRGLDVKVEASSADDLVLQAGDTRVETSIADFASQLNGVIAA